STINLDDITHIDFLNEVAGIPKIISSLLSKFSTFHSQFFGINNSKVLSG
ncbi:MAG: hypothetical protein RIS19_93, partial [Actinomycetota bacterium]